MQNINPNAQRQFVRNRPQKSSLDYIQGICKGDRVTLSQAITLVESTRLEHQIIAQQIIEGCLPHANKSVRIGITGTPGVGKSTFIEAFGTYLTEFGRNVAVLAIDPSSQVSRGSILGDKTRMERLSMNEKAFIRPSPAGESLGGVARKTRETIILCEAAGFDTIIVETVGVGQSETTVHSMTDFFLLLLLPGAGDELQGIKRGIVEMADMIAVNKADGDRLMLAKQAKAAYQNALHLFPPKQSGWSPKVVTCSAISDSGIQDAWQQIETYYEKTKQNGFFEEKRHEQARFWLYETIQNNLNRLFYSHESVTKILKETETAVIEGKISSFQGAEKLLKAFVR